MNAPRLEIDLGEIRCNARGVVPERANTTELTDDMVGGGIHVNAIGGDCPGKTELHRDVLLDFSTLRCVRDPLGRTGHFVELDLVADPDDPRDLYGVLLRARSGERSTLTDWCLPIGAERLDRSRMTASVGTPPCLTFPGRKPMQKTNRQPREPSLGVALISLFSLIIGIGISIAVFGLAPHLPMLFGVAVASLVALYCGYDWPMIQAGMVTGITHALGSIIILLLVGILIGVWILGGVVPTLVFYGLQIFSPSIFLAACAVICAIASSATGTSWGTTGTIGVALMGVGAGLGLPLPMVAGAVLSGSYFGDKMSPLSDTTNMAPAMVGVDLYVHIRHMMSTTGVSFAIALVVYAVMGMTYTPENADASRITAILAMLEQTFVIHPLLLTPPLLVMVLSFGKIPAIPGIAIGAAAGFVCAMAVQGADYATTITAAMSGYAADTGNADVDSLLSRGGLESMAYTVSLIIVAMMFGGVMQSTGQIQVVANAILSFARSTGSLILTTALTAIGSNFLLCDQYMSLVLTGRMYAPAYRDRGLAPENLSRVTEDAGTVIDPLVPWGSGGAYQTATLGVPTILYAPFAVFCWVSPLVTILFGYMGWTIRPLERDVETEVATVPVPAPSTS